MKKNLVYSGLIILTLWPLVHIYLTKAYSLSPWKLAGWGMYAAPRLLPGHLEFQGQRAADQDYEPIPVSGHGLRAAGKRFMEQAYWLRDLVEPDEVAEALFAKSRDWQRVRIRLHRFEMNPASGIIEPIVREYEYSPPR